MSGVESEQEQEYSRPLGRSLSAREQQLLVLAAQGFTDQGIAHKLGISLATVGTYWGRVRIKFGPLNRTELVAVYLREESSATIDELKKVNSTLLSQVEEYARSQDALKANLQLFQALIETAPDAIVVVTDHGVIELANERAEQLFGYGHGHLVGLPIEALVPARYHAAHTTNRAAYMESPVRRKMGEHLATVALRKDGTEFAIAAALNSTTTPNGVLVTCLIRDLSDQIGAL